VNSRSWRRRGDSICQERIKTIPMTDPAAASHQESEKSPLRSIYSPIAGLPARSCWWRLWCMSQHAIQKDSFCSCEDSSGFVLFILACRTDYLLAHRRAPPEMMGAITSVSLITRPLQRPGARNTLIPLPDHFECATASSPLSKHRSPGSDSIQTDRATLDHGSHPQTPATETVLSAPPPWDACRRRREAL
jgi:hypothetical protein